MNKSMQVLKEVSGGRYVIRQHLGTGRFGDVYLGSWNGPKGAIDVSLKFFSALEHLHNANQARLDMHREAQILAALDHPSIVRLFAVEVDGEVPFLVEEFLAGGSLAETLSRRKEMDPQSPGLSPLLVAELGLRLARGLEAAHARDVFHGDVKPSNICFRDLNGAEPCLVDFGQGGFFASLLTGVDGQLGASLAYMSPERTGFLKHGGSTESDLYSLGVTLYECACGRLPFRGKSPKDVIGRILTEIPTPIVDICPEFPEPLAEIIHKLMRKNPKERYRTSSGLAADLEFCARALAEGRPLRHFALGRVDKVRELNYRVPLIGREAELSLLMDGMSEVEKGGGAAFLMSAPSGSGKSRLGADLCFQARSVGARVTAAAFSEIEKNIPLSVITMIFMRHAETLSEGSLEEQNSWKKKVLEALGKNVAILIRRFPFYGSLLPRVERDESLEKDARVFSLTVAKFLCLLAPAGRGHVLFLDDLQWADRTSIEVIHEIMLMQRNEGLPGTLFLGSYRSNEVDDAHLLSALVLPYCETRNHLFLSNLNREQSRQLVQHILDEEGPEVARLHEVAFELTSGSPFFIYECIKNAISSGAFFLNESDMKWHFDPSRLSTRGMSRGLEYLVSERISRLPATAIEILQAASVTGVSVSLEDLSFILERRLSREQRSLVWPDRETLPFQEVLGLAIDLLLREHLVVRNADHVDFFHDKIREAAYGNIEAAVRSEMHAEFGALLSSRIWDVSDTASVASKAIFEAASHVLLGHPERTRDTSRALLLLAARRAMESFSYGKARDYLEQCSRLFAVAEPETSWTKTQLDEWLQVHELLADTLFLSGSLHDAVALFERILNHVSDSLHRATIYSKEIEVYLSLLLFAPSKRAGQLGLAALNVRVLSSRYLAVLMIAVWLPGVLWAYAKYRISGSKRTRKLSGARDIARFELLITHEVTTYFMEPLVAVANLMPITRELLFYEDCLYRARMVSFWGVATANLGFTRTARRIFSAAHDYFESHPNPVAQGFNTFVWGYLLEFPVGNIEIAMDKHKKAYDQLTQVGESFYRYLALQGMMHIDYFGLGNGEAAMASALFLSLQNQLKFETTCVGCTLKYFLFEDRLTDVEGLTKITIEGGQRTKQAGFDTIDSVYAMLGPGESAFLQGDLKTALPLLKEAFHAVVRHFHRVAYCSYAPIVYAIALVHSGRPVKAIPPILFAWLNQVLGFRLFLPQTLYATGELFFQLGFASLGRKLFLRGIRFANRQRWSPIVAEGRWLLGQRLAASDFEAAEFEFERALRYFDHRHQAFPVRKLKGLLQRHKQTENDFVATATNSSNGSIRNVSLLRSEIESTAILGLLLRLSELSDLQDLLPVVAETLASCSGAEIVVVFLVEDCSLSPAFAIGASLEIMKKGLYSSVGVDKRFVDLCFGEGIHAPKVRSANWMNAECVGSAMFLPIEHKGVLLGGCYLANRHIVDLFDGRTLATLAPIASQTAVALSNIAVVSEREGRVRLEAEIEAANAVQNALLPERLEIPGMEFRSFYRPAAQTGGDWFGLFHNREKNRAFLFIGDVTGHGFSSALVTGVAAGSIFSSEALCGAIDRESEGDPEKHLRQIVETVNAVLNKTGGRSKKFMTMFFLSIDLSTGEAVYTSAGHPAPMLIRQGSEGEAEVRTLVCVGTTLGFSPEPEIRIKKVQLEPGDILFLFTDGLLENRGPNGKALSSREVRNLLARAQGVDAMRKQLLELADKFWQDTPGDDDVSFLIARWNGALVPS